MKSEEISKRLDKVLQENERLLKQIKERLAKIDKRQNDIEETDKALEGSLYLSEWKEKGEEIA